MSEAHVYPVPAEWAERAMIGADARDRMCDEIAADPDRFWLREAMHLEWITPPTVAGNWSFDEADFGIEWFADGALNVAANCLDRHLDERGEQTAIIWEGDDPSESRRITYRELHNRVCRLGSAMRALGVRKGDRVTI